VRSFLAVTLQKVVATSVDSKQAEKEEFPAMYPITVSFVRFEDVYFSNVLNSNGVYVIWDSQARAKPSYIGEGDLLSRLAQHDDLFAKPVKGYIALFGPTGKKSEEKNAEMVEALLLEVARETNRWPIHNGRAGDMNLVRNVSRSYGLVKISLKGCDPFGPPTAPRYIAKSKHIWFELDVSGKDDLDHDWNLRKRLAW